MEMPTDGTAVRALRCHRRGSSKFGLWGGNNSLRSSAMSKILGIVVIAISLIGGATVVLAQSSRDLTEPTGTEANRLRTQTGGYYGGGDRALSYAPGHPRLALFPPPSGIYRTA